MQRADAAERAADADAAPARLLAAAAARARADRRQQLVAGMSELLRRTLGETDRDRDGARRRPVAHATPTRPARERDPQSRRQRPRRHARGRQAHHRDRQLPSRRALCSRSMPSVDGRPVCDDRGDRHRQRHDAGGRGAARSIPSSPPRRSGKGTGLGLSQVYGFVKQSGGHIKIYQRARPRHDDQALSAAILRRRRAAADKAPQRRGADTGVSGQRASSCWSRTRAGPARYRPTRLQEIGYRWSPQTVAARRSGSSQSIRTSRCCSPIW